MKNKLFDIKQLFFISLFFISLFSVLNLFFGDNTFKKYNSNVNKILALKSEFNNLEIIKKELTYFINQFEKQTLDFKEIIIRKELNYLGPEEKVIFYD